MTTAATLSFTRGLFLGRVHSSLLFPYPPPLDERNPREAAVVHRLVGELQQLAADGVIDPARSDAEETISDEVIHALAAMGMLGLTIPKRFGGLGLSASGYARVFGALSALDASAAVLVGVQCGLGAKAIVLYGNEEQQARYLPPLARGDMLAAYALTEPDVGSDAQHIKTTAQLSPDGTHWTLNGRKIWIGNGHRAGVIVTFAQTAVQRGGEPQQRPTAFIIRPDMPGFRVVGTVRKLGIRGSTQAELAYENLQVPADHVLGTVGKGFSIAVHVLNGGRMSLAAGCTAGAKQLLGEMARYAEQRVQFGRPLAGFEITQRKLARVACDTYAADAMLGILAELADRESADYAMEAACCKLFASELIWYAADEMVQIAGGRGYVQPYPYERTLRDARINRIFEGANEVLRLFIALNGVQAQASRLREVGTALRNPIRQLGLLAGYATTRVRSALGGSATLDVELDPRLSEHRRYFEQHVAELAAGTERVVTKYREGIVERQLVLERLAGMAVELFATAAVISRTQRFIEQRGVEGAAEELALCDLFCVEAGRRFREYRQTLDSSDEDETRRTIAAAVRQAGGYAVPDAITLSG